MNKTSLKLIEKSLLRAAMEVGTRMPGFAVRTPAMSPHKQPGTLDFQLIKLRGPGKLKHIKAAWPNPYRRPIAFQVHVSPNPPVNEEAQRDVARAQEDLIEATCPPISVLIGDMQHAELPGDRPYVQIHYGIRAKFAKLVIAGLAILTTIFLPRSRRPRLRGVSVPTRYDINVLLVVRGSSTASPPQKTHTYLKAAAPHQWPQYVPTNRPVVTHFPPPVRLSPHRRRLDDRVRRAREHGFETPAYDECESRRSWCWLIQRRCAPVRERAPGVRVAEPRSVSVWREQE
ncbi:hypothetical protein DL764_000991 [Monosporascus ibericus]|uniref:Uncharacterized protein n=1 Tax=Monosporascus ibericus TaxID=155417 RepID=A0A4Q4TUM5_9PEZI|nr:hypothetical protein DL764_000991 [Monosporascus ibericus]